MADPRMDSYTGNSTKPVHNGRKRSSVQSKSSYRKKLTELENELSRYRELYLRQVAEMDNYAKTKEKEIASIYRNSSREVVKSLLPFMDSLEAALKHDDSDGLLTLKKQIIKILSSYGFSEIPSVGKAFNPYLHEAIGVVESNDDNIIVEEIQKGYMLNDEVIRTSKVIVGRRN
ncbi:MAG: nucleotide exchange factor GrpE [Candidatus Thermoplasmatota archaeon]|nr:nucleotide exchange factor GrpE [Candidatus Thermoplasmatota archaeon]MCL5665862.1 nucleotide exchange factor GrpE [Candidatus Thermoplasmatota archaeon]